MLLDLFSRRVVGWATSDRNDTMLALAARDHALQSRHPWTGLIYHTDRGSPYASEDYRVALARQGIVASMRRTGDCYDNVVAESFFASPKAEWVDHEDYATRGTGRASLGG